MFLKYLFSLLFIGITVSGYSQLNDISRPDAKGRFIAFISPNSTEADIDTLIMELEGRGFKLSVNHLVHTTDGQLKSFSARLVSECGEEPFRYEGNTDFAEEGTYPLAILFIGEDCSSGVMTTTFENVEPYYDMLFPTKNPEVIHYSWDGSFEAVSEVQFNQNFTVVKKAGQSG